MDLVYPPDPATAFLAAFPVDDASLAQPVEENYCGVGTPDQPLAGFFRDFAGG